MKRHILISLTAGFANARVGESLGIRYIKAYLNKNGYEVDILEYQFQQLKIDELVKILENYDVIGFSINYCGQVTVLKDVLHNITVGQKIIYLGGHFATICYEKLLEHFSTVDFVMLADGEYATLELVKNGFDYKHISNSAYREKDQIICTPFVLVDPLDQLPFPYRDQNSYYLGDSHFSMITSRGCYNNCAYCSVGSFTKNYFDHRIRYRSAQNIYDELRMLKEIYHVKYITFQDDLFVGADSESQIRARNLAKIIIENRLDIFFSIQCSAKAINYDTFALLYKAGLRNVMIGIENFTTHALQCFHKPQSLSDIKNAIDILRKINIPISYGFIMYYPEMEHREILDNIEILHNLNLINLRALTNKLQIYIGTPYYERKLDDIIIEERTEYTVKYQFKNPQLCMFIKVCEAFKRLYGHIEGKLQRLEFLSYSNSQIDAGTIAELFTKYRECLYCYSKAAYEEIFEKVGRDYMDTIRNQMLALEEAIGYIYGE